MPQQEDSGDSQPQLGISKAGDRMLRKLLVGSAHYILGPFGPGAHVISLKRQRKLADLVATACEVGNLVLAAGAHTEPLGGLRQTANRPADGTGKIERQQDRNRQRAGKRLGDVDLGGPDRVLDHAAVSVQQNHAKNQFQALHGRGGRQLQMPIGVEPDAARNLALEGRRQIGIGRQRRGAFVALIELAWRAAPRPGGRTDGGTGRPIPRHVC